MKLLMLHTHGCFRSQEIHVLPLPFTPSASPSHDSLLHILCRKVLEEYHHYHMLLLVQLLLFIIITICGAVRQLTWYTDKCANNLTSTNLCMYGWVVILSKGQVWATILCNGYGSGIKNSLPADL